MNTWQLLLAFSAALAGFAALSLAMDRHHADCHGRGSSPGRRRPWLQAGGSAALLASLWAAIAGYGTAQGWVLWFGALTVSAMAVVLTLSYAPRHTVRLLATGGALALLSALGGLAGR